MWFPTFYRWCQALPQFGLPLRQKSGSSIRVLPWKISRLGEANRTELTECALLQIIRSARRNQRSIPDALDAFASDNRLIQQVAIRKFAHCIRRDPSVAAAAERCPNLFANDSQIALRLAETTRDDSILDSMIESKLREVNDGRVLAIVQYSYWAVLSIAIPLLICFHLFFIHPTLRKLSNEFEVSPSPPLELADGFLQFLSRVIPLLLLLGILLFFIFASSTVRKFIGKTLERIGVLRPSSANDAMIYSLLAFATKSEALQTGALATLAKYFPNRRVREKFLVTRNDIELGTNAWTAMREAGLITPSDESYLLAHDASSPRSEAEARPNREAQTYLLRSRSEVERSEQVATQTKRAILLQTTLTILYGLFILLFVYYVFLSVYLFPFSRTLHG